MSVAQLEKIFSLAGEIELPASKSISNRLLIIDALTHGRCVLKNLSDAKDTQLLLHALSTSKRTINAENAGTAMRFLTAYFAIKNDSDKVMTGSPRMKERPIGPLIKALREIGFTIEYTERDGYPPILIRKVEKFIQNNNSIKIIGNQSSQYISALLLVAPLLPKGLEIVVKGSVASKSYIDMTVALMHEFGVSVTVKGNTYKVPPGNYVPRIWEVEADWSSASYFFGLASLAKKADIFLNGLRKNSLQGDQIIAEIMQKFGVETIFKENGIKIIHKESSMLDYFEYDFSSCPDLAQTVAFICAGVGKTLKMKGVSTLRLKETDRVHALKQELKKIGATLTELDDNTLLIQRSSFYKPNDVNAIMETYDDHRMAMAAAMLVSRADVCIKNPAVVNKSFPSFWEQLQKLGIKIKRGN